MGRSPKNRSTAVTDLKKVNKTVRRQRKKKNIVLTIEEHPKYIGTNVEKRSKYEKVVKWEHGKHWSFTGHKKGSFTLHLHFPSAYQPRWNGAAYCWFVVETAIHSSLNAFTMTWSSGHASFTWAKKCQLICLQSSPLWPAWIDIDPAISSILKRGLRLVTSCKKTKRHHVCNTSALHQHYCAPLRNTALHIQTGHISQWGHRFIPADL